MYDLEKWTDSPFYKDSNVKAEFKRVKKGLDELLLEYGYRREGMCYRIERSNDDTIVIFCHMAVSLLMIGYMLGIAPPLMWHGFFAAPSTLFEIQTEERADGLAYFRVRALGEYSHLYSAGEPCSNSGFYPK